MFRKASELLWNCEKDSSLQGWVSAVTGSLQCPSYLGSTNIRETRYVSEVGSLCALALTCSLLHRISLVINSIRVSRWKSIFKRPSHYAQDWWNSQSLMKASCYFHCLPLSLFNSYQLGGWSLRSAAKILSALHSFIYSHTTPSTSNSCMQGAMLGDMGTQRWLKHDPSSLTLIWEERER